ncbi:2-oxoacid:acceptor oxidoreductase subunit alpha [Candidatus Peregrinibacteria bacterium]|nr:2-oxoacid:acceptor oxidoreductase subunit alpha [Candidatus Peregrinibacteria bacterium]MBT3598787.1 2-oxoacid:acceptor oxidoreductase subunit alpha [Candidatus Peregrinibacteria bacterium]MBT4367371.1 2-oxoacid:acceptor oxidoreductase subunit alpha [Candidatus Peregrinibacteria bacterium]MBT4585855.1 2-oxoacid:acceptor oxidoreductase subunit alpha [Candidatus Peregrinibacteria bacterium]MBT6731203.1 2-oxoacid:acceptor oxidoreductase subunit alpha [Candidatus Peregrinibacteria bacterium]
MNRISIKVTGAQGQGVNSVGEICGMGLKRSGYCVFGYREYMSLIKGGHSSYQLDISDERIESSESRSDVVLHFNHHGLKKNLRDVKDGGIILHQTPMWEFPEEDEKWLTDHNVKALYIPMEDIIKELDVPNILGNIYLTSFVWALLNQSVDDLKNLVREQFAHKGENIINMNFKCIDAAIEYFAAQSDLNLVSLPKPDPKWKDALYITGSAAQGMGVVHAGCRVFVSYPMTPASPLLTYISKTQNQTGIVVKQAEDEITAAQMMSGSMLMGARAMTATSGGGFDLMTETVSMNALIENPAVFALAQRPGPSTGLPTWTAQGDLLLSVGSAHGEFPRLVIGLSNSQDAFDLMPEAFNFAEEFQIPVIVLTDKHIAEGLYTQQQYDQNSAELRRGKLITDTSKLKVVQSTDRYDPSVKDGVSSRWLPGTEAAVFASQGDEHDAKGTVNESSENAIEQMEKRMRKAQSLKDSLPEPVLFNSDGVISKDEKFDLLIVGWGSTKSAVLDVLKSDDLKDKSIGYLHWQYLWPIKTDRFEKLSSSAKKVVLVEQNYQGQLGMLIKMECGKDIDHKILKYDGRPFFSDELYSRILPLI